MAPGWFPGAVEVLADSESIYFLFRNSHFVRLRKVRTWPKIESVWSGMPGIWTATIWVLWSDKTAATALGGLG